MRTTSGIIPIVGSWSFVSRPGPTIMVCFGEASLRGEDSPHGAEQASQPHLYLGYEHGYTEEHVEEIMGHVSMLQSFCLELRSYGCELCHSLRCIPDDLVNHS